MFLLGDPLTLLGLDGILSPQLLTLLYTLGFGGLISSTFYYFYYLAWEYIERRFTTSVTVESADPVYKWVLKYLIEKDYLAKNLTDAVVKMQVKKNQWWLPSGDSKEKPKVEYYPAPGLHFFMYNKKKMWATQTKGDTKCIGWENKPETQETIVIMCYGGSTVLIRELIDEAVVYSMDQDKGLLGIYQVQWSSFWHKVMTKKARTVDSVVLDEDIAETLTKDIRQF